MDGKRLKSGRYVETFSIYSFDRKNWSYNHGRHRDYDYMQNECKSLIDQLRAIENMVGE